MLFQSEHVTAASGSIGGVTYSHTRSGMYRRARAVPVNPNTDNQIAVRSALTECVTAWVETLSASERAAWDLYGLNVTVTNPLGASFNLSGQNWFIGANTPRLQALSKLGFSGTALIETAPIVFDRGTFTTPSAPTYSAATGFSMAFTNADEWANEADALMLIFQGKPRQQSRNFFKGPYRLVGMIEGDDSTPPSSPKTITAANIALLGYPITISHLIRTSVVVLRADGRFSTRRELPDAIATA